MPEAITLGLALKTIAPHIIKYGVKLWNELPFNTTNRKAASDTAKAFENTLPGLESHLVGWLECEEFKQHCEKALNGQSPLTDEAHVKLFIDTTGFGLGISNERIIKDALQHFYNTILNITLEGPHANQLLFRAVESIRNDQKDLIDLFKTTSERPQLNSTESALTNFTTPRSAREVEAKTLISSTRSFISKRRARTALEIIEPIHDEAQNGEFSDDIRHDYYFTLGLCYLQLGLWDKAERCFIQCITLSPTDDDSHLNLAQALRMNDKLSEAVQECDRVLKGNPKNPKAIAIKLACLHEQDQEHETSELLKQVDCESLDADLLYVRSYIYLDRHEYSKAEALLRACVSIDDKYPEAWEMLGRSIAIPAQLLISETAPSAQWIDVELRVKLMEAANAFTRAIDLLKNTDSDKALTIMYANRGFARAVLGAMNEASADLELALSRDPSVELVLRNLAGLNIQMGKSALAIDYLERLTDPSIRAETLPMLAAAYIDTNQPQKAIDLLEPYATSVNASLLIIDLYLIGCHNVGAPSKIAPIIEKLLNDAESPELYRVLSEHYWRTDDQILALNYSRKAQAAASQSEKRRYTLQLANMLLQAGLFSEAAVNYEAVDIPTSHSAEYKKFLIALVNSSQLKKALSLIKELESSDSIDPQLQDVEAFIYELMGDLESANSTREKLLKAGVEPSRQTLRIALNLYRRGNIEEAARFATSLQIDLSTSAPELLKELSSIRTLLDLPDALSPALAYLMQDFNSPESHLFYINTFIRRSKIDSLILNPTEVGINTEIVLKSESESLTLQLTSELGDLSRNIYPANHPLAKALLGRAVGDSVSYPSNSINTNVYRIESIRSKFEAAYSTCLNRFNDLFPDHQGLFRFRASPESIESIKLARYSQELQIQQALALYNSLQIRVFRHFSG